MSKLTSKQKSTIRRILSYSFMVICVVLLSSVLLLLLLGYRFNKDAGKIEQGGLVQFISQPSDAEVTVGKAKLANHTRSKITLNPGDYKVTMTLKGYKPWQKNITVKAGTVLWLNSAHFVPENPITTSVENFDQLGSMSVRQGGDYIALLAKVSVPEVTFVKTNDDSSKVSTESLPEAVFASGTSHEFSLGQWSNDDDYVLVKHVYDSNVEWIALNREDPEKSLQLPLATSPIEQILFDSRASHKLLIRYADGSVVGFDIGSGEKTAFSLQNIQTMSQWGSTLFYTARTDDKKITTGYLTLGSNQPRVVGTYDGDVRFGGGQYFGNNYLVTSISKQTTIQQISQLSSSDSTTPLQFKTVKSITTPEPVLTISFKNNGRFVVLAQAHSTTVYDLELENQSYIPTIGQNNLASNSLPWLDDYHFWSNSDGKLRQYEFDGTNQTDIVSIAPGFGAVYSPNQKYLFSVAKTESGYDLQRTKMIIN